MTSVLPYGSWPSPISADDVARAGVRLYFPQVVGDEVWWIEGRPEEGGRQTVVRRDAGGHCTDLVPAPFNARSRVHEYGGLPYAAVPTPTGPALVFVHFGDQRMYRVEPGGTPQPLTPDPGTPSGLRYADLVPAPDGTSVWCVREAHDSTGRITRHIVTVPVDGSAAEDPGAVREVVSGSDFLAWPRPSRDGRRLAWIAWDHPRMPWDGTELRVADLGAHGTVERWDVVCGGPQEALYQPEWAGPDSLFVVSDRTGWWNLYEVGLRAQPRPLCPREEEFAGPLWTLGGTTYVVLDGGATLAAVHGTGTRALGLLDVASGQLRDLDLPYTWWEDELVGNDEFLAGIAGSPTQPSTVVGVDRRSGTAQPLRRSLDRLPDPRYLPATRTEALPGPGGREVHAVICPPANPDVTAPDGDRPPWVVMVHGGPTGNTSAVLSMETAFFTSRGIGVIDVDYGGSTGYGREYRERLRGLWGVVDVEDSVAAVQALVDRGEADGRRLAIRGGSAGGWTTLAALTLTDVFAAGTSYYGVAELVTFVADTHDFESRYIDGLVGPLPEAADLYRERAPLSHVDDLSCPVLLIQGDEDKVVLPAQSEMFRDALARKGIPHAYLLFRGEQHGLRKAESRVAALEAELSFYGQVMGFDPPGIPPLPLSDGSPG